jgi:opacity protein-like surface antigen
MNRISRIRKSALLGTSALTLALFASGAAQAQCVATGDLAVFATANLTPIASGGSVNSLVSVLNTTGTAFLNQTNAFIGAPGNPQPNQAGGGVWARGVGGRFDTDSTGTAGNISFGGIPLNGNITCNTTTRTEFTGYQAGADLARLNVGGWNLHGGVTVGYVESDARDITPGGSFSGNFQVPFAGLYGAATYGGFYVDAQIRGDFYQSNISDAASGVFNQNFDARGIAFSANIGYNHAFSNGWFVEPSAGIVWSRVEVDPFNVSGTFILANSVDVAPPATIAINDIESLLGRLSLRVGTTVTAGNFLLQPFFTASVFHEFADDVTTNFVTDFGSISGAGLPDIRGTLTTNRIGTYEQFSLGLAGLLANTGWLGYVRGDYRTGERVEGWQVSGGIRYQFTPELLPAAPVGKGIVTKAPPAPIVAAYNWTGFYVGGHAGTTWGQTDWLFTDAGTTVDPRFAGVLGGGQVGFNYQVGSWVFGVEADGSWTNAKGARPCPNGFFFVCENHIDSLFTVTGRIGFAVDRALFYVKGGYAAADYEARTVFNPDSQLILNPASSGLPGYNFVPPCPGPTVVSALGFLGNVSTCPVNTASSTASGWTIGGGFEWGLTANWSAKAEYMFYDLGTETLVLQPQTIPTDVDIVGSTVKVGVNYRFSGLFGR